VVLGWARVHRAVSGNSSNKQVMFGLHVLTRLIIGSGSCYSCLCNWVSRVDPNPTRLPELPTLGGTTTRDPSALK
jgi:hypothetical protein